MNGMKILYAPLPNHNQVHRFGKICGDPGDDVAFEEIDQRGAAAAAQYHRIGAESGGDVDNSFGRRITDAIELVHALQIAVAFEAGE
jgi:hypothetical protein